MTVYVVLVGDTDFGAVRPSVRLLPEYDVFVLGFREREHLLPEPVREQVASGGRGRPGATGSRLLLVDGLAAGVWQRRKRGRRIELEVAPARRLTRAQRAAQVEADRIGASGLEPALTSPTGWTRFRYATATARRGGADLEADDVEHPRVCGIHLVNGMRASGRSRTRTSAVQRACACR